MQKKKIVPLTLAVAATAIVAAGASELPQTAPLTTRTVYASQAQNELVQALCGKFDVSFCGGLFDCPTLDPETPAPTPDETPDLTPDETPDLTPDLTPDETPDETPDQTPITPPDVTPPPTPTPDETPDQTPDQTPDADAPLSGYAAEVVRLVNAERAKNGLSVLSVDAKVQQAAQVRAREQAQLFSHTRPNGASCFTALTEAGVSYHGAGENIAYGQTSPSAVMNAWMNSEGHRANILNANFTTIGVGYTVIGGTAYWAQMFTY